MSPSTPPPDLLRLGTALEVRFQLASPSAVPGARSTSTGTLPLRWRTGAEGTTVLAPLAADAAVWLSLRAEEPVALQVAVDGIDAITGASAVDGLRRDPQSYVVVPLQRWLDGIATGDGRAQPLRGPERGANPITLRLVARRLRARAFADWWVRSGACAEANRFGRGEQLRGGAGDAEADVQEIVPDPFDLDDWDPDPVAAADVQVVDPTMWPHLTGADD